MRDGKTQEFLKAETWLHYTPDLNEIIDRSGPFSLPRKHPSEVLKIDFLTPTPEEQELIEKSSVRCPENSGWCDVRKATMKLEDGTTMTVFLWNPNADLLIDSDNRRHQFNDLNLKSIISTQEKRSEASQKPN